LDFLFSRRNGVYEFPQKSRQRVAASMITNQILERPSIRTLSRIFADANEELYLVGGSVRDAMTGLKPSDIDFTTSARPDKIIELVQGLGTIWTTGQRFGTIGCMVHNEKVELTTFRADKYDGITRKPEVLFGDNVEEDLARRDFTLNAMAVDTWGGELIDPYGGETDLRTGLLRTPVNPVITIREDPLRSLRAVRFAVLKGYEIDSELRGAIFENSHALSIVSQERKTSELMKIANTGVHAIKKASALSSGLGIYRDLFGELKVSTGGKWWSHYGLSMFSGDPIAALAASVIPVGSDDIVNALLEMKFSSNEVMRCAAIVKTVKRIGEVTTNVTEQRRLVRERPDDVLRPAVEITEALAGIKNKTVQFQLFSNGEMVRRPLPVDGYDMMGAGLEGKQIGEALRAVENWYLETLSQNKEIALAVGLEAIRG